MSTLQPSVDRKVLVITLDGRVVVGTLRGFDQTTNIILTDSEERIFSPDKGVQISPMGVYLARGDNIAIIGELDMDTESSLDFSSIKAIPIESIHQQRF